MNISLCGFMVLVYVVFKIKRVYKEEIFVKFWEVIYRFLERVDRKFSNFKVYCFIF